MGHTLQKKTNYGHTLQKTNYGYTLQKKHKSVQLTFLWYHKYKNFILFTSSSQGQVWVLMKMFLWNKLDLNSTHSGFQSIINYLAIITIWQPEQYQTQQYLHISKHVTALLYLYRLPSNLGIVCALLGFSVHTQNTLHKYCNLVRAVITANNLKIFLC